MGRKSLSFSKSVELQTRSSGII
ncbi:hypothetical protein [Escherichia coli]